MDEYFLRHPLYWFQVWLVHDKNFLMFNILYHSSNFTGITRLVNGTGFIFCPQKSFLRPSAFCSSKDWIVLAGYLSLDFEYSQVHVFPRPWVRPICFRLYFVHYLNEYALSFSLLYPNFEENLQMLHPHVQRFLFILRPQPSCGWNHEIQKFIHHIYWKSKLYICNINIIHKHGTCFRSQCLRELIHIDLPGLRPQCIVKKLVYL